MIKTNYHNHCYLCGHAQGYPIDYIKKAVELGYTEFGISDHGPLYDKWVNRMNIKEFYDIYLKNIDEAIEKYKNQIKIYKGLELEYLEGYDDLYQNLLRDLDYLILGQHVVVINGKIHDIFKDMNEEKVIAYKDAVIQAMRTGYFKILAHPDVFMFKFRNWNFFTEKISREIIETAIECKVFLEINANGIRRGEFYNQNHELTYIYPRIEFWRIVKEYQDAKVIISEDNHALHQVGDLATKKAKEFADKLGLKVEQFLFGDKL